MALAPLGVAFGPVAMGLALLGAALACLTASTLGSGRLAVDAGAALAVLTGGLVAALLPHAGAAPELAAWVVLRLVAVGIAAGGVLTLLFGLLRIGGVVKFTPYPVRVGLSTAVGLLLITGALPALLGQRFGHELSRTLQVLPGASVVGFCALGVTALAERAHTRVPPVLLGLAAATAVHGAALGLGWGAGLGPTVGVPELPAAWFGGAAAAPGWLQALQQPAVLALLAGYALTVAVVASLDTLLAASIIDGRLRLARNANRELLAQGLANLASAVVGGLPASPAVPASMGLATARPAARHIVAAYAAALLAVLLLAPQVLGALPTAAVGGVLVYLGALMITPTLWQTPAELWRLQVDRAGRTTAEPHHGRHLAANWVVTLAVALGGLLWGLGPAVLIGASCAVLLFVRANIRDVVRQAWDGSTRHSLKTRPAAQADALRREGRRIALLELEGSLFFGTADALRERLQALPAEVRTAVLDLHQVGELDLTGARILYELAEDWQAGGRMLVFAEWPAQDLRRRLLLSVAGAEGGATPLHFAENTDLALEQAEDRLLQALALQHEGPAGPLALAQTLLARGLSAAELALLDAQMRQHAFARGEVLFRAGDAGDALFVILQGEVGLRVPGSTRRLASFAAGTSIGEMAVLAGAPRSAEAVAESEVLALALPAQAFQALMLSHPALAARLAANIALHLADRIRILTADLAGWMQRAGAGRG